MSASRRLRVITQHLQYSADQNIHKQNTSANGDKVIIIGGGLAGLSAAHTVLERGGRVLLIDKNPFMGGNSTKATSGINGAGTRAQRALKIEDTVYAFEEDTALSASKGESKEIHPLGKVLVGDSGPAVEWLTEKFGLDLSIVGRLGGHSFPRTHRGKEKFPGMTITYALMEKLEKLVEETPNDVQVVLKAKVTKLLSEDGAVIGVEYVTHDGKTHNEYGPVIITTGGYAADFEPNGLLEEFRPEYKHLPTTNGEHCTGDGIKMIRSIGGGTVDLKAVQVHPTGLVHPDDPDAKVKWLAAEALRGAGGLILDKDGNRFCNELGRRDYVTQKMWDQGKNPYYLVLNSKAYKSIEWHCLHYKGRGLMKYYNNGAEMSKDTKIPLEKLKDTYGKFNEYAKTNSDPFGLKFFDAAPFNTDDSYYVAIITPVLHYTMGGVEIDTSAAILKADKSGPIPGVFAGGEVAGGIHGLNRLGGSSLLDCVVFGRVSGASAAKYLLQSQLRRGPVAASSASHGGSPQSVTVQVRPDEKRVFLEFSWDDAHRSSSSHSSHSSSSQSSLSSQSAPAASLLTPSPTGPPNPNPAGAPSQSAAPAPKVDRSKQIGLDEIAKHNKNDDCWVAINGQVLDVTGFLDDHPGGRKAIMLYAGKEASEEFNMLHAANVVEKYAPQTIIGTFKE